MKKLFALILSLAMVLSLTACGGSGDTDTTGDTATDDTTTSDEANTDETGDADTAEETGDEAEADETSTDETTSYDVSELKIGLICVEDEQSGYDAAHINGLTEACQELGIDVSSQVTFVYNIGEDEECYDTAVDLAEAGCDIIISDSYGHQSYMLQAAQEYSDIIFIADTGDMANQVGLDNYKNLFTYVYQSRYVSGVVAGMKIAELVENGELTEDNYDADGNVLVGYVGAYPYAEVVSGYTAFYLGIKSVYPDVSMQVQYTNSWYDWTGEYEAANTLMANGCVIIGQHADSTGAPSAVQAAYESGSTVYCVGYNIDMLTSAPDTALTSAQNNWSVIYRETLESYLSGAGIPTDFAAGYADGAVQISALGPACADGTEEKVAEVEAALTDGSLQVFDVSAFTIDGVNPTSILIDMDLDYVGETEGVVDGVFQESVLRSAPGFEARIDGITELNNG